MKRLIGNIFATLIGLAAGYVTIYFSLRYLREPQSTFDWVTLIASGMITGVIGFFVTWGHFQEDPMPPKSDEG